MPFTWLFITLLAILKLIQIYDPAHNVERILATQSYKSRLKNDYIIS